MKPGEGTVVSGRVCSGSGATVEVDVEGAGEGEDTSGKAVGEGADVGPEVGAEVGAAGNLFPLKNLGPYLPVPLASKTDVPMEEPGSECSGPWEEP